VDNEYLVTCRFTGECRVFIGSASLIGPGVFADVTPIDAVFDLTKGYHPITVLYFHTDAAVGVASDPFLEVRWVVPGQPAAAIPLNDFRWQL